MKKITHSIFCLIFLTGIFLSGDLKAELTSDSKPNVILIMTDDQGIGDFGFTGNPYIQTPHLDKAERESKKWVEQKALEMSQEWIKHEYQNGWTL